jgi:hypothetical protein
VDHLIHAIGLDPTLREWIPGFVEFAPLLADGRLAASLGPGGEI